MSTMRSAAAVLGAAATLLLFLMVNPWINVPDGLNAIVTVAFWALTIALFIVLYIDARQDPGSDRVEIEGPAFVRFLTSNSRAGLVWLPVRLFVGFAWLEAGWHKASGGGWLDGGAALAGFWKNAASVPDTGHALITYDWYRSFINVLLDNHAQTWFGPLIAFGEMAVGLGLIFGVLTGFAAFFGSFMNMSFMLAGSASTNPVMFALAVGLILSWKVAGYYGVDRWLLPILGTPWNIRHRGEHVGAPLAASGTGT
jgi:thiosulfate dehydrogenase [quinone] large subunit